jgi:hypothetical protein
MADQKVFVKSLLAPSVGELVQTDNLYTNPRGDQYVTLGVPAKTDIVRQGRGAIVKTGAIACVTALPTTTASAYLWNGEPVTSNVCYVIDRIAWTCTTSAAAASMFALAICVGKAAVTQPATTQTLVAATLNGRQYVGAAGMGITATITDDGWTTLGNSIDTNALTATVGASLDVPVDGGLIIAPGRLLSLACIAVNTTAAGRFFVHFHEVELANK